MRTNYTDSVDWNYNTLNQEQLYYPYMYSYYGTPKRSITIFRGNVNEN